MINESLDDALHAVAIASARRATTDPRHATLEAVLIRARDSNLATARALKLDRVEKATKHELETIRALLENNPHGNSCYLCNLLHTNPDEDS